MQLILKTTAQSNGQNKITDHSNWYCCISYYCNSAVHMMILVCLHSNLICTSICNFQTSTVYSCWFQCDDVYNLIRISHDSCIHDTAVRSLDLLTLSVVILCTYDYLQSDSTHSIKNCTAIIKVSN